MTNTKHRKTAQKLIQECGGKLEAYAAVCNELAPTFSDEELLGVKHYLEYLITADMIDELGWEQTDTGTWRKVENEEFWGRLRAKEE